jgi:hypothetical protein
MSKKLKGLVFTALDNAYEGGYRDVAHSPEEAVAQDLMDHDADVEREVARKGASESEVAAMVQEWQISKRAILKRSAR